MVGLGQGLPRHRQALCESVGEEERSPEDGNHGLGRRSSSEMDLNDVKNWLRNSRRHGEKAAL